MSDSPIIDVERLNVMLGRRDGPTHLVKDVSFVLGHEKLGIVGESGAGKSTVGRSIMRLLPPVMRMEADKLRFREHDLLAATEGTMRKLRGGKLSLIMQDPKYSLNPLMTVGDQIAECWTLHHPTGPRREARERTRAMLDAVRINDVDRVASLYPHEVSGGMGQRVMIAMMLISNPEVLIADEPTSALDVTVKMEVIALLDDLIQKRHMGLLFISHDLSLVRHFCDRVVIMYAGRVVETVRSADLNQAAHPYTRALLSSMPSLRFKQDRLPVMRRNPAWAEGGEMSR